MEEVVIRAVQPFDLHGVRWYQIVYTNATTPEEPQQFRCSFDVLYPDSQPGDRVRIQKLLGVVNSGEKV